MTAEYMNDLLEKVLEGNSITYQEGLELINIDSMDESLIQHLLGCANKIREKYAGNKVDLCTIVNAKSGKCSEDCKYCAQSSHYTTKVDNYGLLEYEEIKAKALEVQEQGAHRFSLVTSGKGPTDEEINLLADIYKRLKEETHLKLCASHGVVSYEQVLKLKEAGVSMYHHNIECCEEYYGEICTTHAYEDRINTINNIKKAGLEICCGGIIGLGENREQRVKMAFEIKSLDIKSIPINVLNPIKGTPMESNGVLTPNEILKTMAVFRFILPDSYIRYAGGRAALKDKQQDGFKGGINAALVGDFLTTIGSKVEEDKEMIQCAGLEI